jgi:hypothetical protein
MVTSNSLKVLIEYSVANVLGGLTRYSVQGHTFTLSTTSLYWKAYLQPDLVKSLELVSQEPPIVQLTLDRHKQRHCYTRYALVNLAQRHVRVYEMTDAGQVMTELSWHGAIADDISVNEFQNCLQQ